MDSEEKPSTPKLSLFPIKTTKASPEHPWAATPPHRNFLSVPFRWEEEPGKPLPCLALATIPTETAPKSLELPPRLLFSEAKLHSPTTVLDGPYVGRQRFQSSSFRSLGGERFSPEKGSSSGSLGALVLSKRRERGFKGKGLFGSLLKGTGRNYKEASGGSYVFPSSGNRENDDATSVGSEHVKIARIRRTESFSALSQSRPNHPASRFWVSFFGFLTFSFSNFFGSANFRLCFSLFLFCLC